jgi:hypothetical protein
MIAARTARYLVSAGVFFIGCLLPILFESIHAQLVPVAPSLPPTIPVTWQFKEWISLVGAIMTAAAPIITMLWYIGNKHLSGTMKIAIQEANERQTQAQKEMLEQLRDEYVPSMKADVTGAEIKRHQEKMELEVIQLHREIEENNLSRLRHERNNLEMINKFFADHMEAVVRGDRPPAL